MCLRLPSPQASPRMGRPASESASGTSWWGAGPAQGGATPDGGGVQQVPRGPLGDAQELWGPQSCPWGESGDGEGAHAHPSPQGWLRVILG